MEDRWTVWVEKEPKYQVRKKAGYKEKQEQGKEKKNCPR